MTPWERPADLVGEEVLTDADTLGYEYRINDLESFTAPWTVQLPMTGDEKQLFEYACHEGNYGIVGSLSGRVL